MSQTTVDARDHKSATFKPCPATRAWSAPLGPLAAAAALALAAPVAQAAALGAVSVQSALGEPLRAEVQLLQLSPEDAAAFNARMAPPGAFAAAGVPYSAELAGARVSLQRRPSGEAFLRITTEQPVHEPVLGMVIEADWASGQMTRDYTVLPDPPGRPVPVALAATMARPVPQAQPVPRAQQVMPPVVATQRAVPAPRMAQPATSSTPIRAAAQASAPAPQARVLDGQWTVQRGDTASKIARAHSVPGVSLDQMLLAILRANPNAFIDGNVNLLRAGAVLQIPTADQVQAVAQNDAQRIVRAQTADFENYRSGLARSVATTQSAPGDTAGAAEGQVEPRVADTTQPAPPADRLEISKDAASTSGAASSADVAKTAQARQAEETAERVAELDRNLNEMAQLQAELDAVAPSAATTADAGTSTPSPAAAVEAASDASTTASEEPAAAAGTGGDPTDRSDALTALDDDALLSLDNAQPALSDDEAQAPLGSNLSELPDDEPSALPDETAEAAESDSQPGTDASATVEATPLTTDAARTTQESPPANTLWGITLPAWVPASAIGSALEPLAPYLWPIVAILIALLGLLGIERARQPEREPRRKRKSLVLDGGATDPAAASAAPSANEPIASDMARSGAAVAAAAATAPPTTLANDPLSATVYGPPVGGFADSAFTLTVTESDPSISGDLVQEAAIYLEYGHDAKAEELLNEALAAEPQRTEIYAKLAAIQAQRGDQAAFSTTATRAQQATGGQGPVWDEITRLGRELDPQNPLYGTAQQTAAPTTTAASAAHPDPTASAEPDAEPSLPEDITFVDAPGPDTASAAAAVGTAASVPAPESEAPGTPSPTVEFINPERSATSAASASDSAADLDALDFKLDDIPPAAPTPPPGAASAAAAELEASFADLTFALTGGRTLAAAKTPQQEATDAQAADELLDLDIEFLLPEETETEAPPAAAQPDLAVWPATAQTPEDDTEPIEFRLDDPLSSVEPESAATPVHHEAQPTQAAAPLPDGPLATKLALAREFADIGDRDGARSMVQEVVATATGPLKDEANALLKTLQDS